MTLRGFSAVDSYYEYIGFAAQQAVFAVLEQGRIFWIVVLCGLIAVIVRVARGREPPDSVLYYIGQLILLGVMMAPAEAQLRPKDAKSRIVIGSRAALIANTIVDGVIHRAIERVDEDFARAPFAYEHLASVMARARFHDAFLANLLREFADQCATPALAAAASEEVRQSATEVKESLLDLWDRFGGSREEWMVLEGRRESCARVRALLQEAIDENLATNELYRQAEELYGELTGGATVDDALRDAFVRRAVANEIGASATETDAVRQTLPSSMPTHGVPGDGTGIGDALRPVVEGWDGFVGAVSDAQRWLDEGGRAKYMYGMLLSSAPHVYGLALMTLLALFPFVALFSFLPARWPLLITYLQVYLSVKAWPLLWAMYSALHRGVMEADEVRLAELDGWEGPGVITLLAFYFATPALTLTVALMLGRAAHASILSGFARSPAPAAPAIAKAIANS